MNQAAARRLPGIRFEGAPRTLDEALPRMDVAAFVGFAERGPIDLPVVVESLDDFTVVFGGELRLAWDRQRGRWTTAQLANAVRAFFANGGTRCWVVRVAGEGALGNQFTLSGLGRVSPPGQVGVEWRMAEAFARARSAGSWSDGLRIATRLRRRFARVLGALGAGNGDIELTVTATPAPQRGDLLRVLNADGSGAVFVPVREVLVRPGAAPANTLVVRSDRRLPTVATTSRSQPQVADADIDFLLAPGARTDVVSVDLRIEETGKPKESRAGRGTWLRFDDLGLVPGHPRYWADLPTDAAWYGMAPEQRAASGVPSDLRFCPMVAERPEDDDDTGYFIPWDLSDQFGAGTGPAASMAPSLARDGLDRFDAALFSDPELIDATRRTLLDRADNLRYRNDPPRRLRGMHALLGWSTDAVGEEASVFAIPDAVQPPWTRSPELEVQACFEPVDSKATPIPGGTPSFGECSSPLPAPVLDGKSASGAARSTGTLSWTHEAVAGQVRYRIERHIQANAQLAEFTTLVDSKEEYPLPEHEPGEYFYRVRIERGDETGPWSAMLRLVVPDRHDYELDPNADSAAGLQTIHETMLTLAAARGDLFAILSLPAAWRENDALRHARHLRDFGAASADGFETGIGSHGALYHPWLESGKGVASPPDGTIVGIVARRARERGAWVAPANLTLRDAIALSPALHPALWPDLQEARINVLRREPSGFTVLGADTLADDGELRPIQVRRLLSTLRRLVQRIGAEFVFEANGEALQSAVESRFERALEALYRRGAFVGRRAGDSFQVSARSETDPSRDRDAGRLVVELRVRPAQALRFITVRLTQTGAQSVVTEIL